MTTLNIEDFSFELPKELIAQEPISGARDQSKLLVLDKKTGAIEHKRFFDVVDYLKRGDVLVFNNSRVIPARLSGYKRNSGGAIEILLVRPRPEHAYTTNVCVWEAMIRWKSPMVGARFIITDEHGDEKMSGQLLSSPMMESTWLVEFDCAADVFYELVEQIGHMPIPPYIRDNNMTEAELQDRYQTVYASVNGSVAAPTAGLHFTPELLETLRERGVECVDVTLHVGLGTFQPIKTIHIENHVMHSEAISISEASAAAINAAKAEGRRIIAVGTTATRVLESFAEDGKVHAGEKETTIFMKPGYEFQIIDGLITNFHLPKSTLLLLVSAFGGTDHVRHAYSEAIAQKYRFYSFGDAMLII